MLLLLAATAHASVLFGAAWTPVGVGALAWSESGSFSGTLAGEFDGLIRPPLTIHGGWVGAHDALLGNLAVVQVSTARFAASDALSSVGGVRIGLDWRRYLFPREPSRVNLYTDAGLYGIIPNATETDNSYTEAEQADAAEGAAANRARVGGLGAQGGMGAEYLIADAKGRPAVAFGVRWLTRGWWGQQGDEDGARLSTVVASEAALVIELIR